MLTRDRVLEKLYERDQSEERFVEKGREMFKQFDRWLRGDRTVERPQFTDKTFGFGPGATGNHEIGNDLRREEHER